MHVIQLNEVIQKEIECKLETAIRETGIYNEEEIKENVERGMYSRLHDLSDTIDITPYLTYIGIRNKITKKLIDDYGFLNDGAGQIAEDILMLLKEDGKLGLSLDNNENIEKENE